MNMTENEERASRNLSVMLRSSKMNIKDIAEASGRSDKTISRYANMVAPPDWPVVMDVCRAMDWDFDCVIGVGKAPNEAPARGVCENIVALMRMHDETPSSLAESIGVSIERIYVWLRGESRPRTDPFVSMCIHWQVTPTSFAGASL